MENHEITVECLSFIEANLETRLSLDDIALHMGYSKYHFTRLFKKNVGMKVSEYVKKRRLLKASDAILKGDKIIDAALNCGYQSHSGFTKVFKQEYGFSPVFLKAMLLHIDQLGGNAMEHIFLRQINEKTKKEELYTLLQEEMDASEIRYDCGELKKVYDFACEAYGGMMRYSGDEYVTHPLHTAIILAQMGAGDMTIYGGMLCDVLGKTDVTEDELTDKVPSEVKKYVVEAGAYEAGKQDFSSMEEVVMIKLAERLHNMRTVACMDARQQKIKARETIQFFLPLANRMGNEKMVSELNNLALKYI